MCSEIEALALITAITEYHSFLANSKFVVYSDHISLKWLHSIKMSSGRLARWLLLLQGYQFEFRYKKGTTNVLADDRSRRPYGPPPPIDEDEEFLNDHHFIATISQNRLTDTEREETFFEYDDDTEQAYKDTNEHTINRN